ncbi:MAG: UDP-N-acetylmuramoyl-tripeptide--D-alanyl-D-alanine ligase [Lentimicrobium sp.]|nr:UDP-N-acetylmuramoyl-tripeptide--D-alanyl-D-alanine ligase [Lentimicrobium sp.]
MPFSTTEELFRLFKQHPFIITDSRAVRPGSIFFGLKGDSFDGNHYAQKALDNGAAYAVIDNSECYTGPNTLLVPDVLKSLQELASLHRESLEIPIIGITGTNGKTTTKELLAAALSVQFKTFATQGNLNNHIGVPLSLLSVTAETEIAVIEMGANHIGEIDALCKIARPTHGLITNIGKAHLQGFGSPAGVIQAKKELYDHLYCHGGTVFINSDNPLLMGLTLNLNRVLYGESPNSNYLGIPTMEGVLLSVQLKIPESLPFPTQLTGRYNFENVLAAIAVAGSFRVNLKDVSKAMESYQPKMNRSQILETSKNTLLLDAYNANPSSMESALENFAILEKKPKILILGDMFELGDASDQEHEQILTLASKLGFSKIFTAGPNFMKFSSDFIDVTCFESAQKLKDFLIEKPLTGNFILVKGSRGMKLEILTDAL